MKNVKKIGLSIITFAALAVTLIIPGKVMEVTAAPTPTTANTARVYFDSSWTTTSTQSLHYWFADGLNGTNWDTVVATSNMKTIATAPSSALPATVAGRGSTMIKYLDVTGNDDTTISGIIPLFKEGTQQWRPGTTAAETNVTGVGSSKNGFTGTLDYGKVYLILNSGWTSDGSGAKRYDATVTHAASFITLDVNEGTLDATRTSFEVNVGSSLDLIQYVPTRDGYAFGGWALSTNQDAIITAISGATPATVVAQWIEEAAVKTVSFDVDGSVTPVNVSENETVVPINDPTKRGFEFIGWYLDNVEFNFATPIVEDIVLTAKWEYTGVVNDGLERIYFNNSFDGNDIFAEVYCFAFFEQSVVHTIDVPAAFATWPGSKIENIFDSSYYFVDLPFNSTVIFNDGKTSGDRYQTNDTLFDNIEKNIVSVSAAAVFNSTDNRYEYSTKWNDDNDFNLNAKFQLVDAGEGLVNLRILSTLGINGETLAISQIEKVGFVVNDPLAERTMKADITSSTSVYEDIIVLGESVTAESLNSLYFFAIVINGVPVSQELTVTPYVVVDGTYVFGAAEKYIFLV